MSEPFQDGLPVIRSRKNDRLRLVGRLQSRRGRRTANRFLLEGPKVIIEVLEQTPRLLEQVLYRTGKFSVGAARVLELARARGVPCYPVAADCFDATAPSESPQALLGVARMTWTPLERIKWDLLS